MAKVIVKIENAYSDGHTSEKQVIVDAPNAEDLDGSLADWWEEKVWPETGDGHGAENPDLGTCYTATILGGEVPFDLIGEEWEWV